MHDRARRGGAGSERGGDGRIDAPGAAREVGTVSMVARAGHHQREAAVLGWQRGAGNAAVQRALRGELFTVQRDREAPPSLSPRLTRDALYEQMAHGFAYMDGAIGDEGMALLDDFDYTPRPVTPVRGTAGLQLRTFHPTAVTPPGPTPVVAFRGTEVVLGAETIRDVGADLDAGGIGLEQFFSNAGLIERWMRVAAASGASGKVIVCGHSLGGALAQIAAAVHSDLVEQVVTFQAPGINRDLVERMARHNQGAQQRGVAGVGSTHYRATGDVVPLAGEGFTPGRIHNISMGLTDPLSAHQAFITTTLASQRRTGLPLSFVGLDGATDGTEPVSYAGSESTDENNTEFRATEALRRGAGVLGGVASRGGGPLGAIDYLMDQRQLAEMQRVWLAIQAALAAGRSDQVAELIDGSVLNGENRARMAAQARMSMQSRQPAAAR